MWYCGIVVLCTAFDWNASASGGFDFTTTAVDSASTPAVSSATNAAVTTATNSAASSGAAASAVVSNTTPAVSDTPANSVPAADDGGFDFTQSAPFVPPINVSGGVGGLSDGVPPLEVTPAQLSVLPLVHASDAAARRTPVIAPQQEAEHPLPPEELIRGYSVADILTLWSQDLHDHWIGLSAQAKQIRTWDHQLSENGKKVCRLTAREMLARVATH